MPVLVPVIIAAALYAVDIILITQLIVVMAMTALSAIDHVGGKMP